MKLSIITINYNNAEGLRKTMESVLAQTYTDIEYVIVDGASTDGSVDVIRELATRPTIKWVSEKDKGIYNAMNKGIEVALGKRVVNDDHTSCLIASSPHCLSDYIQILNSGDILAAPDVTERMMAALASYSEQCERSIGEAELLQSDLPSILYGNMIKEYPDGKRVEDRCFWDRGVRKLSDQIRKTEWTMYDFIKGTINHDPTYIRSDIYEKYGLYDDSLKIVSDWKWFVQAVVFGAEEVYYIPMDVTIFDMTGISETNLAAREKERRIELEKMFPMAVLKDYDAYHFPISQIQRLKCHHLWPLVYFVERVLFKLEKWRILK